jgi:hypothetical protein
MTTFAIYPIEVVKKTLYKEIQICFPPVFASRSSSSSADCIKHTSDFHLDFLR